MLQRSNTKTMALTVLSASVAVIGSQEGLAGGKDKDRMPPITIVEQGSFAFGGTVLTAENGDTFHGDHGYVQYQIPTKARKYPIVMWHGGGQYGKTWESTPDGREGYQSILLRNGYSTYILDQPRRGRAGRTTVGTTILDGVPGEASLFNTFRLGTWSPPTPRQYFPGVQFPRDAESLSQYFRQVTPNTGPEGGRPFQAAAGAALFGKIGPAILMTHSAGGVFGWRTAMLTKNVRAIISYEPATFAFPQSDPPPPHWQLTVLRRPAMPCRT